MPAPDLLFGGGLAAYLIGAAAGLALVRWPAGARFLSFGLALLGATIEVVASGMVLARGGATEWNLPFGVPLFSWTIRLDPISAYFSLALGSWPRLCRSTRSAICGTGRGGRA